MKKIFELYITGFCFLISNLTYAQPGLKIWDKRFGGTDYDYMYSMIATADGGYLLGGSSYSGANGDKTQASQGSSDYWVVKIDGSGNKVWDKRFGGIDDDDMISMIATADGGYLLGGHSLSGANGDKTQASQGGYDYWVVKIDGSGNKVWDKRFGGIDNDAMRSMIATVDGGYLLGGWSYSGANGDKTQASQGYGDYWVVKIDGSGNKVWDKRFGGSDYDLLKSIISTSDGGYLLGGHSLSGANGDKTQASQGGYDYWVVKIDGSGNKVWDKRFGGTDDDLLNSIISTSDGGYLLGGHSLSGADGDKTQASQGNGDYWVVKIDGSGNKAWDKRFGGTDDDYINSMIATADGGYLLGGSSYSGANGDKTQASQGNNDYWVVKIDGSGNKVWDKRFGGTDRDHMISMIATADGGFLLGGSSYSGANGDKTQASQGYGDYWVVKISGECTLTAASITPSTTQNTCAGSTLAFSGNSTGGTSPTYAWSSSPIGFSSSLQNPSFTTPNVTQSTNYVLTLTVAETGCTATVTATTGVTVSPTPTVNAVSNQAVTVGSTTSAINFGGLVGNTTYSWTNDNTSIGLAASGTGDIPAFTAVNTGATAQVANITVTPITYGYAYVANVGSNSVSLINTTTNTVVKTITVGARPSSVVVSPDGSRVYVANLNDNSVSVINTFTNTVIATVGVGTYPEHICISPDGSRVYSANTLANSISVINTSSNTLITTFSAGTVPENIIVSSDGNLLYLSNSTNATVSVINATTYSIIGTISVGARPQGMALSLDNSKLYVANHDINKVSVINTSNYALITTINVGTQPFTIKLNKEGNKLYVLNRGSNTISVINTSNNTIANTITLVSGSVPNAASFNTEGTNLYVTNYGLNNVSVINTSTNAVTSTIAVGTNPSSLGSFTTGFNCTGIPKNFSITVNPPGPINITQMEYFIDADPGYGSGTAVSFTEGSSVTTDFPVNISSTTDGFHFLNLRAKDGNNNWSIAGIRPFYKETIPSNTLTNLNQIEYFIDNDPGYGLGTAINFSPSSNESLVFTVLLSNGLADGFHFLSVRAKDVNNNWSIVGVRPFYKETLPNNTLPNITAMEYFIDNDPGYGLGTALSFTANSPVMVNFNTSLSSLSSGTHKLFIRAKNVNNQWSIVGVKEFVFTNTFVFVSNVPSSWCTNTTFNLSFTAVGTYNVGNIFTAQLSDVNGSFANPTVIGVLSGTVSNTIVATIPNNTTIGSGYLVRVISSNPSFAENPSIPFSVVAVCPSPCPTSLTLVSTADDYSNGILVKEVNSSTGIIIANNKITSTANVTYRAGKSITLDAGFKADNGTVFKTEFGGCN